MGRYKIDYENWSKEGIKELGDLLNDLMTTLDRAYANDSEEASWLRNFETNLDELINKEARNRT